MGKKRFAVVNVPDALNVEEFPTHTCVDTVIYNTPNRVRDLPGTYSERGERVQSMHLGRWYLSCRPLVNNLGAAWINPQF
jgi:hypothetical protein